MSTHLSVQDRITGHGRQIVGPAICGRAWISGEVMTMHRDAVTCEKCLVKLVEHELESGPAHLVDIEEAARALGKATRKSIDDLWKQGLRSLKP